MVGVGGGIGQEGCDLTPVPFPHREGARGRSRRCRTGKSRRGQRWGESIAGLRRCQSFSGRQLMAGKESDGVRLAAICWSQLWPSVVLQERQGIFLGGKLTRDFVFVVVDD